MRNTKQITYCPTQGHLRPRGNVIIGFATKVLQGMILRRIFFFFFFLSDIRQTIVSFYLHVIVTNVLQIK